jgi:hypothetical protein
VADVRPAANAAQARRWDGASGQYWIEHRERHLAADDPFVDPRWITDLLSGAGWGDIQITPITERAWIGSDVDDVMSYVRGMPRIRDLAASLDDPALTERVLATIAEEYAARQGADGVWVYAAAWLVTARRA